MLAGAGAEAFADTQPDIERVPNSWFDTRHRRRALDEAQSQAAAGVVAPSTYFGTVGAVALDAAGPRLLTTHRGVQRTQAAVPDDEDLRDVMRGSCVR